MAMISGGPGKDWVKIGDMWINDSREGWESAAFVSDVFFTLLLTVVGLGWVGLSLIGAASNMWIGILLAIIGIVGVCSDKLRSKIAWGVLLTIIGFVLYAVIYAIIGISTYSGDTSHIYGD